MRTVKKYSACALGAMILCICRQPPAFDVVEHTFPNGALQERYSVLRGTNQKEGLYEEWFDSGQKYREVLYRGGRKNGLCVEYSPFNNEKRLEALYRDDQLDGRCIEWYREGGLKTIEKEYHKDKYYNVKATWYFANGRKSIEIDFDPLKLEEVKTIWNEQGVRVKKIVVDRRGKREYNYTGRESTNDETGSAK